MASLRTTSTRTRTSTDRVSDRISDKSRHAQANWGAPNLTMYLSQCDALDAGHRHRDAYMLITYRCEEHRAEREQFWNSRDGEAATVVTMSCGSTGVQAHYEPMQFHPDHVPALGDRVFVDLTPERARIMAMQTAARWWADENSIGVQARELYLSELGLICALYDDLQIEIDMHCPDLVRVDAALARERGWIQQVAQNAGQAG